MSNVLDRVKKDTYCRFTISTKPELLEELDQLASELGFTRSKIATRLLNHAIEQLRAEMDDFKTEEKPEA